MKRVEDTECFFPATLEEALALQSDESTRGAPIAGGTDLLVQMVAGATERKRLVSVLDIPDLKRIEETETDVSIGAAVTHSQLRNSPIVREHLPALAAAAATVGSRQIQNRGTIGGNVANASPAGDLAPALLIAGGSVVLASQNGARRVPIGVFHLGYRKLDIKPDELIVRFILPKLPQGAFERFTKLGTRAAQAISKVMGACRCAIAEDREVESFAVAMGSVSATPIRLAAFEEWIVGRRLNGEMLDEVEERAAACVSPIDDIRSTAEYRKWASGRIVRGFVEDILK